MDAGARKGGARSPTLASIDPLLVAIVALGAALRFGTIASQGYWFDEAFTVNIVSLGPLDLLNQLVETENSPPSYYLLAAGWERLLGSDAVALRSLSALLGTTMIPVVYAAGTTLGSRRVALVAAMLTAASPLLIWYSQEARPYAFLALLSAVSFLAFVETLGRPTSRWLWLWALASALALSTHYLAAPLVVTEALWLLGTHPGSRRRVMLASGAVGAAGLALAPLALAQGNLTSWISRLALEDRLAQVAQHFVVGMNAPSEPVAALAVLAVAGAASYGFAGAEPATRRSMAVPAGVLAIAFGAVLVGALVGADYLISRNLIGLWAPFAIILASLLTAPAMGRLGLGITACLCAAGIGLAVWTAATPSVGRPDWEELSASLEPFDAGSALVSESAYVLGPLTLSLEGARVAHPGERVVARDLTVVGLRQVDDHSIGPCWWVAFCGGEDLFPSAGLRFPVPSGLEPTEGGSTRLFEYRRYRVPRTVELSVAGFGNIAVPSPGG
jgi:mannosyltransferase